MIAFSRSFSSFQHLDFSFHGRPIFNKKQACSKKKKSEIHETKEKTRFALIFMFSWKILNQDSSISIFQFKKGK